ncbi:DUF3095 domain-containing protein [Lichenihabitans psoromatis]|uniref:DUF3095 domain-containing protein n=1 Tax=Lichenihabitans psoromatis TaxID=2528642 RepID=UPI0010383355|nr:DUF3095 domain-containing protein [Lichenihabitans psoromatis]
MTQPESLDRDGHGRRPALGTAAFYRSLVPLSGFHGIADSASFAPLPDDWVVGIADVVSSSQAIAEGRYKTVNTAGAAVISAVSNALGTLEFPFIFGGDGASFAVGPEDAEQASAALAATVAWVGRELNLVLRGGIVSVSDIRAQSLDVRVARFAVSNNVTYAMFAGGGLAWAERRLKAGDVAVAPAPKDAHPDLTGLTCRFHDLVAKHGVILSVLVRPTSGPDDPRFQALVREVLHIAEQGPDEARPMPVFRPGLRQQLAAIGIDARMQPASSSMLHRWLAEAAYSVLATVLLTTGWSVGGFSPKRYLREVVENSDFRKYDDGLMMTLDCTPAHADRIETRLQDAARDAIAVYGLHRQDAATITCVIPSVVQSNHVHFIDGASGGYAEAARDLKSRLLA